MVNFFAVAFVGKSATIFQYIPKTAKNIATIV